MHLTSHLQTAAAELGGRALGNVKPPSRVIGPVMARKHRFVPAGCPQRWGSSGLHAVMGMRVTGLDGAWDQPNSRGFKDHAGPTAHDSADHMK